MKYMKTRIISIAATLLLAASVNTAFAENITPRYYLIGQFNGWNNDTKLPFEENNGVYTLTPTTKISGEFKIFEEGRTNLLGANVSGQFWLTKTNSEVDLYEAENAAALYFQFEETYTFTIKDNKLSVNLDDYLIAGSFNYWAPQRMTAETDGSYTFEVNGGDQFKIRDFNGAYYGGDSPNWENNPHEIKDVWHTNISMITGGANFKIVENGTYTVVVKDGMLTVLGYSLTLNDNGSNETTINTYNNQIFDVVLNGRTLVGGQWNTLCLPFEVGNETEGFAGTPLAGADVREFSGSSFNNGTLTLTFSDEGDISSISSGAPYIVNPSNNVPNPTFTGVTITSGLAPAESDIVNFIGTFAPETINGQNYIYLGAKSTLYWPQNVTIGAFRAYFELADGYTAGEPTPGQEGIKAFVLNFGDDTNSIQTISNETSSNDGYFTLDGRRLNDKPATAGLYIINGKKVVIK